MTQLPTPQTSPPAGTKLVIIALIAAVVAVALVNLYIEMVRRQATEDTFTVYFLTQSVRPGDKLRKDDVRAEEVPKRFKNAFLNTVSTAEKESRMGERFQRAAEMNTPLTFDLFVISENSRVDRTIGMTTRRVPLKVNSKTLPGSLRPGMYVDLAAPFSSSGSGRTQMLMVMERVQVRAMGTRSIADESAVPGSPRSRRITNYPTIEIDVTAHEALALSQVEKIMVGDFEIYLRNPADDETPYIASGGINPLVLQRINASSSSRP